MANCNLCICFLQHHETWLGMFHTRTGATVSYRWQCLGGLSINSQCHGPTLHSVQYSVLSEKSHSCGILVINFLLPRARVLLLEVLGR